MVWGNFRETGEPSLTSSIKFWLIPLFLSELWLIPLFLSQLTLKQTSSDILFKEWFHETAAYSIDESTEIIRNYFALETPLAPLVEQWSAADAQCKQLAVQFPGLRVNRLNYH
jgi:hypothetical protein